MDWREHARRKVPELVDAHGDLAPPWAEFPDYERHTIGWRMGAGESWLGYMQVFLEGVDRDLAIREAYLRRHPPAPINWADWVWGILHPRDDDEDRHELSDEELADLRARGLIASDAAYPTWLRKQDGRVPWPWTRSPTPEAAARYRTRELWFFARQTAELRDRDLLEIPDDAPDPWRDAVAALRTGDAGPLDPMQGLASLVRSLCAGGPVAPWRLELSPADFADTFDDDMGYVDAFRLWVMSAFDDAEHIARWLRPCPPPPAWQAWVDEHMTP